MKNLVLLILILNLTLIAGTHNPVIPSNYNYSALGMLAANGSSTTGGCFNVIPRLNSLYTCATPTSSVLFDGVIPTLTALDGDTWARQFIIMQRPVIDINGLFFYFNFTSTRVFRQIEATIFNCPQWGTAVLSIGVDYLYTGTYSNYYRSALSTFVYPPVFSCDFLVKVCIPINVTSSAIYIHFLPRSSYVHLAEVAFYENSTPCPPFTMIPGNWTPATTQGNRIGGTLDQPEKKMEPSIIMSAIAMIIALQTTVIFLVVLVVVCKYNRRKTTPRCPDTTGPVESEVQLYEEVDLGGVAKKSPYVQGKGEEKIKLDENRSYALHMK